MSKDVQKLKAEILNELENIPILCIHSHIDPHNPVAKNLSELVGYHYYTELANSAEFEKGWINTDMEPEEIVEKVVAKLHHVDQTAQYSWLIHLSKAFFGFTEERLTLENFEALYHKVLEKSSDIEAHEKDVLEKSNIAKVLLTNSPDDELDGFARDIYIPCYRADNLVFHIHEKETREMLEKCTDTSISNITELHDAIDKNFAHFAKHDAVSAAISLPPGFVTMEVEKKKADKIFSQTLNSDEVEIDKLAILQAYMINTITEKCREYGWPFQLMIGVNRKVYKHGVYQGQDLFTPISSMIGYSYLFNAYPDVKFPVSVLSETQEQELRTYGWLIHNVYPSGHWWYRNIPEDIAPSIAARIGSFPKNKPIGYYSDAYKLEFVLPKFAMYKEVLAGELAKRVIESRSSHWMTKFDIQDAIDIGKHLLDYNPRRIILGEE